MCYMTFPGLVKMLILKQCLWLKQHPEMFYSSWRRACLIEIIINAMIYWCTTLSSCTGCSFDLMGKYDERVTGSIFGCAITTVALHNSLLKCYHLYGHSSKHAAIFANMSTYNAFLWIFQRTWYTIFVNQHGIWYGFCAVIQDPDTQNTRKTWRIM